MVSCADCGDGLTTGGLPGGGIYSDESGDALCGRCYRRRTEPRSFWPKGPIVRPLNYDGQPHYGEEGE